jgi:putative tryptophan/tyrosine transport system substrate-binding protein
MRRREFITLLGGAAAAWPVAARAQSPKAKPTIGFLGSVSPIVVGRPLAEFERGLNDAGFVVGDSVAIEYRWAQGQYNRLLELAADLVRREVAVIVTVGGDPAALAAKAATSTTPIVFLIGSDPIKLGLAASFNRPGGNSTGINFFINEIEPKRLELLQELVPSIRTVGVLANSKQLDAQRQIGDVETAARALRLQTKVINASTDEEIEAGFVQFAKMKVGGIHVVADPFLLVRRGLIVALATRYAVPTVYPFRQFAETGGLMSYGTSLTDAYQLLSQQVVRVLQGTKPGEVPVMQPTKFELVINLNAAKALGLIMPPSLLTRADEVIE